MIRFSWVGVLVVGIVVLMVGGDLTAEELSEDIGSPPVITSPPANAWFACNAPVDYCWMLPGGVMPADVSGYEVQFSNTQTPDGPWDAVRFFTTTCWHYAAGHQSVWEALYWRVRIVYKNGDRSPWEISYHRVGTTGTVIGDAPLINSPAENAWFACNAPIDYCWVLPGGVSPADVSGYQLQFSNTQTPDGPWDAVRFFTTTCWHYAAGHQSVWDALYWRVRIVYNNGDHSPWAISYHRVGTTGSVGLPPVITSPAENAWFALNAPVDYCWMLPEGVAPDDVSGYLLQFSNTQTPNGPWDPARFFTATCWYYAAGHQCVWEALFWRVSIVYANGDLSPWAMSYHRVGVAVPTETTSWGRIKTLYE